jgi:hypothetical protein
VVSVTLRPLFSSGEGPPVPIVQEAGWAPEPVWTQARGKSSFASAGDWTSLARSSSPSSDTILTELPGLLYRISTYPYSAIDLNIVYSHWPIFIKFGLIARQGNFCFNFRPILGLPIWQPASLLEGIVNSGVLQVLCSGIYRLMLSFNISEENILLCYEQSQRGLIRVRSKGVVLETWIYVFEPFRVVWVVSDLSVDLFSIQGAQRNILRIDSSIINSRL